MEPASWCTSKIQVWIPKIRESWGLRRPSLLLTTVIRRWQTACFALEAAGQRRARHTHDPCKLVTPCQPTPPGTQWETRLRRTQEKKPHPQEGSAAKPTPWILSGNPLRAGDRLLLAPPSRFPWEVGEPNAKPRNPESVSQWDLLPSGLTGTSPSLDLETKCKKSALESFPCEV